MKHTSRRIFFPSGCLSLLLAAYASGAQGAPHAPQVPGTITHIWKPVRRGGGEVVAIEVRTEIRNLPDSASRAFSLLVPITYAGVAGIAERTERLLVRDVAGAVPLRVDDDTADPGGFPYYRHWRATRDVRFPVTVSYDAEAPATLLRGPPFGLYAASGGVSGAGSGFLVLPEGRDSVTTRVHWDLSDLVSGASASTSFGDGDFELRGPRDSVRQGWIMAGMLGRYPATKQTAGFNAVWLGTPDYDPDAEMAWAARMYEWLGKSYGYLRPLPSYRVFLRVGGRGGTALGNSFMAGALSRSPGATSKGGAARETFTHEMGHLFVGDIDAPQGVQSWFTEGLNTYYTRLLPMRGRFTSVAEYGKAINADFQQYWYGAARNLSADSITRIGFSDEAVRHMPYVRSSLYFADLDATIRAHSAGRRTLDEVMRELFERRARGESFNHDVWIATVVQEAGQEARAAFENLILKGTATLVPAPNAFGPCFTRRSTQGAVVNGLRRAAGYEWVRVATVPDSVCRTWGESQAPRVLIARRPATARTSHVGVFGGVRVPYTATVQEHLLPGPDGKPNASLVTNAYERTDVADRAHRPVTFLFNGGPGSSSSQLHVQGVGPMLIAGDSTKPNAHSLLDATDLVFIDPVGTGFSRPFTTEAGRHDYWTRSGDARSVAEVVRRWLRDHGREQSPRYLAGESYGTVRAAVMLRDQPGLRFDGAILVAVVAGDLGDRAPDDDLPFVLALPAMATSAWYHGLGVRDVRTVDEVFDLATAFADSEYVAALGKGAALGGTERDRVAARMATLVGLPVASIASHNLRLSKDDWMLQILADRGLRTGMLDTRVTAPRDTTRRGGLNDPALNGGTMRFGTAMLAPSRLPGASRAPGRASAFETYLTRDLRFPTLETYRSLNLDINVVWDHEGGGETVSALASAMRDRPSMRLFWAGGYFDLTTPVHAAQRAFAAAGMPAERTTAAIVAGPHGVFGNEESRRLVVERLRAWIR